LPALGVSSNIFLLFTFPIEVTVIVFNDPEFEGLNLLQLVMRVNVKKIIVQFARGSDIVIEQSTYDPMIEGLNPAALDTES
jgi:hypothetical protein